MNDKKYIKVVYKSDPIGREGIRLILTTFDLEAFKRDEALSKIPEKRIAAEFEVPKTMYNDIGQPFDAINNHNVRMLETMIEKFVVDTYDKQIQEMKAHIEYLRNAKIVPVECSNAKNINNSGDVHCGIVYGNIKNCDNIYCTEIKGNVVNCDKIVYK